MTARVPGSAAFLLLRKAGALWGIPGGAVNAVASDGGGFRVMLDGGALAADDVLGVVGLVVTSSPAARNWWPDGVVGAAVHAGYPLAVVDAERPPAALAAAPEPPVASPPPARRGETR